MFLFWTRARNRTRNCSFYRHRGFHSVHFYVKTTPLSYSLCSTTFHSSLRWADWSVFCSAIWGSVGIIYLLHAYAAYKMKSQVRGGFRIDDPVFLPAICQHGYGILRVTLNKFFTDSFDSVVSEVPEDSNSDISIRPSWGRQVSGLCHKPFPFHLLLCRAKSSVQTHTFKRRLLE